MIFTRKTSCTNEFCGASYMSPRVTDEIFDSMLRELVHSRGVDWLFNLPGVYEIASAELDSDVLEALGADE
ncbi:MAG: hypothetical protein ACREA0_11460 [bacterium]